MFYNSNPTAFQQQPIFPQMPVRQPVAAIFLDAENIHARHLEYIVDKARQYGLPLNCRAYADWSNPRLKSYAGKLTKYGFVAIHHFATQMGKNSSDMMLSVDAMKMMYQPDRPDVVVLATSDSDFTSLAVQLRALGVMVVGVGNINASGLLKDACDAFHRIPDSESNSPPQSKPVPPPKPRTTPPKPLQEGQTDPNTNPKLIKALNEVLDSDMALDDGRVALNYVGTALLKAGVNAENLGFANASALIHSLNEFEIRQSNAGKPYMIRCLPFKNETTPKTPTTTTPTAQADTPDNTSDDNTNDIAPRKTPTKPLMVGQTDPNQHEKLLATLNALFDNKPNNRQINMAEIGSKLKEVGISPNDFGFATYATMLDCLNDFEVEVVGTVASLRRCVLPPPKPAPISTRSPQPLDVAFNNAVALAISEHQDENGWAKVGKVSGAILSQASISAIQYGYNTLSDAIKASDIFELRPYEVGGVKSDYVRDTRTTPDDVKHKLPVALTLLTTKAPAKTKPNQAANKPTNKPSATPTPTPDSAQKSELTTDKVTELRQVLVSIMQEKQDGEVWFNVAHLGADFRKKGYDPKTFGCKTLGVLINKMGVYETKLVDTTTFIKDPDYVPVPKAEKSASTELASQPTQKTTTLATDNDLPKVVVHQTADEVVVLIDEAIELIDEVVSFTQIDKANAPIGLATDLATDKVSQSDAQPADDPAHTNADDNAKQNNTNNAQNNENKHSDDKNQSDEFSLSDLLALMNQAIATHQNADGYAKVGDIGKYVRKEIGLGATSFGYDDFGKMLELLPQYEVVRIGRFVMIKVKGE